MTGKTLAEVLHNHVFNKALALCLCGLELGGTGHRTHAHRVHQADAITAHLAAILTDPETVEAVAQLLCNLDVKSRHDDLMQQVVNEALDDARAAIAVIAARMGVAL